MSRFTARLVVTPTEDYRGWIVLGSDAAPNQTIGRTRTHDGELAYFGYDVGKEGSYLRIEIPLGFETDFASIPWFARWLIKSWGRHTNPAVIHDYLYRGGKFADMHQVAPGQVPVGRRLRWVLLPYPTRKQADRIMLEGMDVMQVRWWRKWAIYYGLRLGGWWAWRKQQK